MAWRVAAFFRSRRPIGAVGAGVVSVSGIPKTLPFGESNAKVQRLHLVSRCALLEWWLADHRAPPPEPFPIPIPIHIPFLSPSLSA